MPSRKIGVTGAAGYIGSLVTKKLIEENYEVVPIDNFYQKEIKSIEGQNIHEADVRNFEELEEKFSGVDAIMHLAAIASVGECEDHKRLAFETNVNGTSNVAYFCRKHNTPLIFAGSMAAIGDPVRQPIKSSHPRKPLNWYGKTKKVSEKIIQELSEDNFPAHIFLKSNVFGSHRINGEKISKNTVIDYFISRGRNKEHLPVYKPGIQARDFIHVEDVAQAYIESLKIIINEENGAKSFPIASGTSTSVIEIAKKIQKIFKEEKGFEPKIKEVKNPRDETVVKKFDVDTSEAEEQIGFSAERTLGILREEIREDFRFS
jgi:UDP-glucose 4-epimerase